MFLSINIQIRILIKKTNPVCIHNMFFIHFTPLIHNLSKNKNIKLFEQFFLYLERAKVFGL